MINKIRIYDLDGTLIDSMHRYRVKSNNKIDLDYWRANQHKAAGDSLLPLCDDYRASLADPCCFAIVATARVLGPIDRAFLRDRLGQPQHIISRAADDSRSGAELKIKGLNKLFQLKQFKQVTDIIFYEDNMSYLKAVCDYFNITGVYIPSKQGH